MTKRIALPFLFALLSFVVPTVAHAQRKSPLADAPAIRKRVELRESRLEFGAGLGSTINQTFNHGILANVHLGYHITDWLSVAGTGNFNVAQVSTGFRSELLSTIPDMQAGRDPTAAEVRNGINKASQIFGAQLELTPFTGKYAVFGSLFAHYDFYVFAGAAFVNLVAANPSGTPTCASAQTPQVMGRDGVCVVTGMKIGGTYGVGFHSFFNDFVALNIELRDVLIQDNPAGRDVNGDQYVTTADSTWTSHLLATLGVTLYLPVNAGISP